MEKLFFINFLFEGSDDGFIRVWAYSETSNSLSEQFTIPIVI